MNNETLQIISEISNTGLVGVISYAIIDSLSELIFTVAVVTGARAIWKRWKEAEDD